jgi:hypothetical protein
VEWTGLLYLRVAQHSGAFRWRECGPIIDAILNHVIIVIAPLKTRRYCDEKVLAACCRAMRSLSILICRIGLNKKVARVLHRHRSLPR